MDKDEDVILLNWLSNPSVQVTAADVVLSYHTPRKRVSYMVNGKTYYKDGISLRDAARQAKWDWEKRYTELGFKIPDIPLVDDVLETYHRGAIDKEEALKLLESIGLRRGDYDVGLLLLKSPGPALSSANDE